MRKFNVEGPCDPERHFTVMRDTLVRKGIEKVEEGKYITLYAPEQAGKTTYVSALLREIARERPTRFLPVFMTLHGLREADSDFFAAFKTRLRDGANDSTVRAIIAGANLETMLDFDRLMWDIYQQTQKKMLLVIDDFDDLPENLLDQTLHVFRKMYHFRDRQSLHALIVVGVRNLCGVVPKTGSPFNIADDFELPYFSQAEVANLIEQYEQESGQPFQREVVDKIYEITRGHPCLVNALCKELVDTYCVDRSKPVDIVSLGRVVEHFLTDDFDRRFANLVAFAKQHENFIRQLLFGEFRIRFNIYHEPIEFLRRHGLIERDKAGYVAVSVPFYKKALMVAFRP
jgi:hypothetical protein